IASCSSSGRVSSPTRVAAVRTPHHIHETARTSAARQRSVQLDDDELVGIRLARHAARAERIVVVVEDAEPLASERDHALDRLERKAEDRTEPGQIVGIRDVEQIGNRMFDEKAVGIDFVERDEEYFLERRRSSLEVVALDHEELAIRDLREI